jgi:hypothetical protein
MAQVMPPVVWWCSRKVKLRFEMIVSKIATLLSFSLLGSEESQSTENTKDFFGLRDPFSPIYNQFLVSKRTALIDGRHRITRTEDLQP